MHGLVQYSRIIAYKFASSYHWIFVLSLFCPLKMDSYLLLKDMINAFRKSKTSDFFGQKYGGFASKVRKFAPKKAGVFDFRNALPKTNSSSLKNFAHAHM